MVLLDLLGTEVGQWGYEGPTRVEGAPRGVGAPPTSCLPRCFPYVHSKSSGLLPFQKLLSRRFHSVSTPFDIFPFLRNTETREKTGTGTGIWVNRLVPKII